MASSKDKSTAGKSKRKTKSPKQLVTKGTFYLEDIEGPEHHQQQLQQHQQHQSICEYCYQKSGGSTIHYGKCGQMHIDKVSGSTVEIDFIRKACPNGCKAMMTMNELQTHNSVCPNARIACSHGCLSSFLRKNAKKHYKKCPKVRNTKRENLQQQHIVSPKRKNKCKASVPMEKEKLFLPILPQYQTQASDNYILCNKCGVSFRRRKRYKHGLQCPKKVVRCTNGCGESMLREQLPEHFSQCQEATVFCERGCTVKRRELSSHRSQCPEEIVSCRCTASMKRLHFQHHNSFCPKGIIECLYGCKALVAKDEMQVHYFTECPKVTVACPNGCSVLREVLPIHQSRCPRAIIVCRCCEASMPRSKFTKHRNFECPKGRITCVNGCKASLLREDVLKHNLQCPKAKVSCPNGCKVLAEKLKAHTSQCPEMKTLCPKGCSASLCRKDIKAHAFQCPKEEITCRNCCISWRRFSQHNPRCPGKIQCPNRCKARMLREELPAHSLQCPRATITCPNNCKTLVLREKLKSHYSRCPDQTINCPNECGESLLRKALPSHIIRCPKSAIICNDHDNRAILKEVPAHTSQCPKEIIECPNRKDGCKVLIRRGNLMEHNLRCQYRTQCPNGCETPVSKDELPVHFFQCPKALVSCPNGCKSSVLRELLPIHIMTQCPEPPTTYPKVHTQFAFSGGDLLPIGYMSCMNGCDADPFPRRKMEEHFYQCPKATVACPDCRVLKLREDLPAHVAECPEANNVMESQADCPDMQVCKACQTSMLMELLPEESFKSCTQMSDGCSVPIQKGILASYSSHSLKSAVLCDKNCGTLVKWNDITKHKSFHCPKTEVSCPRKCGATSMLREMLPLHYFQCPKVKPNKQLTCRNCITEVQKQHFQEHINCLCPKIRIVCPRRCKTEILRGDLQKHCC